jgi:hypothetical protein
MNEVLYWHEEVDTNSSGHLREKWKGWRGVCRRIVEEGSPANALGSSQVLHRRL